MNKVLRLPANTAGRDLVVGDIHGMFARLKETLRKIQFDPKIDRLISVGDLVDRGPSSARAKDWLEQPWFFAAMGNHDAQYAFYDLRQEAVMKQHWICQPFDMWHMDMEGGDAKLVFKALYEKTYPAIEIETAQGLVGIVHAAVPDGMTWRAMCDAMNDEDFSVIYDALWDRRIAGHAQRKLELGNEERFQIPDVRHVFHGHTMSKELAPYFIANRHYIDTGACKSLRPSQYPHADFTICDINEPFAPLYQSSVKYVPPVEESVLGR